MVRRPALTNGLQRQERDGPGGFIGLNGNDNPVANGANGTRNSDGHRDAMDGQKNGSAQKWRKRWIGEPCAAGLDLIRLWRSRRDAVDSSPNTIVDLKAPEKSRRA